MRSKSFILASLVCTTVLTVASARPFVGRLKLSATNETSKTIAATVIASPGGQTSFKLGPQHSSKVSLDVIPSSGPYRLTGIAYNVKGSSAATTCSTTVSPMMTNETTQFIVFSSGTLSCAFFN